MSGAIARDRVRTAPGRSRQDVPQTRPLLAIARRPDPAAWGVELNGWFREPAQAGMMERWFIHTCHEQFEPVAARSYGVGPFMDEVGYRGADGQFEYLIEYAERDVSALLGCAGPAYGRFQARFPFQMLDQLRAFILTWSNESGFPPGIFDLVAAPGVPRSGALGGSSAAPALST